MPRRISDSSAANSLLVTAGEWDNDVEATEPISRDGRIYRIAAGARLEIVAEGLANPVGVGFIGGKMVLTDINGDFHVGKQKFPDGFIYVVSPE